MRFQFPSVLGRGLGEPGIYGRLERGGEGRSRSPELSSLTSPCPSSDLDDRGCRPGALWAASISGDSKARVALPVNRRSGHCDGTQRRFLPPLFGTSEAGGEGLLGARWAHLQEAGSGGDASGVTPAASYLMGRPTASTGLLSKILCSWESRRTTPALQPGQRPTPRFPCLLNGHST